MLECASRPGGVPGRADGDPHLRPEPADGRRPLPLVRPQARRGVLHLDRRHPRRRRHAADHGRPAGRRGRRPPVRRRPRGPRRVRAARAGSVGPAAVAADDHDRAAHPGEPEVRRHPRARPTSPSRPRPVPEPDGCRSPRAAGTSAYTPSTARGRASVALPARLVPGAHQVVARFVPADATAQSTSSSLPARVTVAKARARVALRLAKSRVAGSRRGAGPSCGSPASGTPTGKVRVLVDGKKVATAALRNGRVVVRLPRLERGTARRPGPVRRGPAPRGGCQRRTEAAGRPPLIAATGGSGLLARGRRRGSSPDLRPSRVAPCPTRPRPPLRCGTPASGVP